MSFHTHMESVIYLQCSKINSFHPCSILMNFFHTHPVPVPVDFCQSNPFPIDWTLFPFPPKFFHPIPGTCSAHYIMPYCCKWSMVTLPLLFRLDALALSVIATATWLAGWVAVTLRYCIKTAKPIRKLFRPSESPITLVSWDPCADTKFQGEPFQRGR